MSNESMEVRMARMEEQAKAHSRATALGFTNLGDKFDAFVHTQNEANKAFWGNVGKVNDMQSRAKGAWWTLVQMGSLTAAVAAAVAWLVARVKGGA